MKSNWILLATVSLAAAITGCSTPAPVRDLAGKGAATVGLAEAALRNYVEATNKNLESRMNLLRASAEDLERERLRRELDLFYAKEAGIGDADKSAKLIETMAAKRREYRDKQEATVIKIASAHTLDDGALAKVPTEKLAAAKKSFVVLSEELSASEWVTLVGKYAKVISEGMNSVIDPTKATADSAKPTKGSQP